MYSSGRKGNNPRDPTTKTENASLNSHHTKPRSRPPPHHDTSSHDETAGQHSRTTKTQARHEGISTAYPVIPNHPPNTSRHSSHPEITPKPHCLNAKPANDSQATYVLPTVHTYTVQEGRMQMKMRRRTKKRRARPGIHPNQPNVPSNMGNADRSSSPVGR